ncbi:MAG: ComF family protein [Verrucomicrobiales bacterium]|nr:ComF family protein [Verrucomicrobiales bacterium]
MSWISINGSGVPVWRDVLLSLIYPNVCEICGVRQVSREESFVCLDCRGRPGNLRVIRPPYCARCCLPYEGEVIGEFVCGNCAGLTLHFRQARAAVVATPFMLDIIHRYKYRGAAWFEPFLGELLVSAAASEVAGGGWDAIVPVPLHPARLREREFNQAERLGRWLSAKSGVPVMAGWVVRDLATRTQALLDRRERSKNVAGAFDVPDAGPVQGARVVVVDDVLTTGATTSAVSLALRRAGAADVGVWTVARGV